MDLHLRIRAIWNNVQSSLWFRPIIAALLAMVLALGSAFRERPIEQPRVAVVTASASESLAAEAARSLTDDPGFDGNDRRFSNVR